MQPGGQLNRVEGLGIVARLWGGVGNHGGLAGGRPQAVFEHFGDNAFPMRKVLLTPEDAEDDVSQPRKSYAAPRQPRPLAASEINEVESRPPAGQTPFPAVHGVLVDVDGEDQVAVATLDVVGPLAEGSVEVKGSLVRG